MTTPMMMTTMNTATTMMMTMIMINDNDNEHDEDCCDDGDKDDYTDYDNRYWVYSL